jgi:succinate-semialdehyde dehydrogenase/glutarate-semialdehyde dehydrogenase
VINVVTASRGKAAEVVDIWLGDARVRKITVRRLSYAE